MSREVMGVALAEMNNLKEQTVFCLTGLVISVQGQTAGLLLGL